MGGPSDSDDGGRLTNSRRDFLHLSGIGAMGLSGIGAATGPVFAQSTGGGADTQITFEQNGTVVATVSPISTDASIEDFYRYDRIDGASANTPMDIQEAETSKLFFYQKSGSGNPLSLVIIHDAVNDGTGGSAQFSFQPNSLPSGGNWVVKDDPNGGYHRSYVDWGWNWCCTDGGAFRGGFEEGVQVTIDPSFSSTINRWDLVYGDVDSPEQIQLDTNKPVTITIGQDGSGGQLLEDFEDFDKSRYGGAVSKFNRTTAPAQQGSYAGELTQTGDSPFGAHTTDTTIEAPITLRGWTYLGPNIGGSVVTFFTQSEDSVPESLNVSFERGHGTFEMNYVDGSGGWGGDEFALASFDFSADTWYEFEIDVNEDASDVTATLFDENGTQLEQISGTPSKQLTSGGFGFGVGGPGSGSVYFDDYQVGGTPGEEEEEEEAEVVEGSVTTLQFIPGDSENPSEGGDPLHSALMQVFWDSMGIDLDLDVGLTPVDIKLVQGGGISLPLNPVFDSWLGGDMTDELPENLDEARQLEEGKYLDDRGGDESFRKYRFENGVSISFETEDGKTINEDTVEIQFNEDGPDGSAPPAVSRGQQENSYTVLHDSPDNTIPWEEWYGTNLERSHRGQRYYEYDTEFEYGGVEGVRVFTIWGGVAGFMVDISERFSDDPTLATKTLFDWDIADWTVDKISWAIDQFRFLAKILTAPPFVYTVLDFVVLADGRRYCRVWDATTYPSMSIYMDGWRQSQHPMIYDLEERFNLEQTAFHFRTMANTTPYSTFPWTYNLLLENPGQMIEMVQPVIDSKLKLIPEVWAIDKLTPDVPVETLGFDGPTSQAHTSQISGGDAVFDSVDDFMFPWKTLPGMR